MDKKIFSKNFKRLVNQQDISYVELSKKVDIRQDKLSKFANPNNSVKPSIDDLIALSQYFNISIDELIGNNTKPKQSNHPEHHLYEFISLLLKLDKIFSLEFNTFNVSFDYIRHPDLIYSEPWEVPEPEIKTFKKFQLSLEQKKGCKQDEIIESYCQSECISKFLEDISSVKDVTKNMPELQTMWEEKTLEYFRQNTDYSIINDILLNKGMEKIESGFVSIPDGIDEELPFN